MEAEDNIGNSVNAAQHIWGYFKNLATEVEKRRFDKLLDQYQNGTGKKQSIKNHLNKLAIKYNSEYLQDSYYFHI